jgi:hypothetical protein
MESQRFDCGAPKCVARTLDFHHDRSARTERFKDMKEVMDYNRMVDVEAAGRLQEATHTSMRRIWRQLQHELLLRSYEQMRFEDGI